MKLYIIRHGETDLNRANRYQGSIETDLNRRGIVQARRAATRLAGDIDALVSSPMRRALQTARIIAEHRAVAIKTMPEFRERCVGIFEGLSKAEIKQRYPSMWKDELLHRFDAAPPGGESVEEVLARVRHGIDRLLRDHRDGSVAVVAHGFVARAVWAIATRPPRDRFFDYALANGDCAAYRIGACQVGTDGPR